MFLSGTMDARGFRQWHEVIEAVKNECNEIQRLFMDFVDQTGARVMEAVRFTHKDIDGDLIV
jgi:hypothetical protein